MKNYEWHTDESVLLCQCWATVSGDRLGPGISQKQESLWAKISERYHASSPPIPMDKRRIHFGPPRNQGALFSKWGRMGTPISAFIKCVTFATVNHHSGESMSGRIRSWTYIANITRYRHNHPERTNVPIENSHLQRSSVYNQLANRYAPRGGTGVQTRIYHTC